MMNTPDSARQDLMFARHLRLPILGLDLDGHITWMNPTAEDLFAQRASDLIGQPFHHVLDVGSHEKAGTMIQKVIEMGHVDDWELDHIRAGRDPFLVRYSASLLLDDGGLPAGIIACGRDLSKQLDLTRQLAETNQQLEGALLQLEKAHTRLKAAQVQLVQSEKMRSLGQMVAGVAHEINNPAAFVSNNLAYLEKNLPALQGQHYERRDQILADIPDLVRESREGIERVRDIVASLRKFSRMDDAEMIEADINEGLQATVKMAKSLWDAEVEIHESYADNPRLSCHPGELNQVFLNLLTNAMQAVKAAGKHGSIRIQSALINDQVEISIQDNGEGMDEATLKRLGEPFFTTRPVGSGMGLGLAVCFGIIERHNGTLTFESQPAKGTTATIRLPVRGEAALTEKRS